MLLQAYLVDIIGKNWHVCYNCQSYQLDIALLNNGVRKMAKVREQGKIYEMINKRMTSLLEKGEVP